MARYERGRRIGRTAKLRTGSTAVILDQTGSKVLLTRRTDNGRWCLPGGALDPGESLAESCVREVREETGLEVRVVRLTGIYSDPDIVIVYDDGNRYQIVGANFLAEVIGGTLQLSSETTEVGFFSADEIAVMDLQELDRERLGDALADREQAVFQ